MLLYTHTLTNYEWYMNTNSFLSFSDLSFVNDTNKTLQKQYKYGGLLQPVIYNFVVSFLFGKEWNIKVFKNLNSHKNHIQRDYHTTLSNNELSLITLVVQRAV